LLVPKMQQQRGIFSSLLLHLSSIQTGHRPPATSHRPPATGHRSPATG
jgi:hypothetical protein